MCSLLNQSMNKKEVKKSKKAKNANHSTYNTKPINVRLTPSEQDELLQRNERINDQLTTKLTRMMLIRIAVKYMIANASDDEIIEIYREIKSQV